MIEVSWESGEIYSELYLKVLIFTSNILSKLQ